LNGIAEKHIDGENLMNNVPSLTDTKRRGESITRTILQVPTSGGTRCPSVD